MYAKLQITGILEIKTGLHIGGNGAFAAIGAVDSPVVRDARTNLPMIPGSSLKGKMRSLLAKRYNTSRVAKPDEDHYRLTRVFGTAKKGEVKRSRVLIADMIMSNDRELRDAGIQSMTEVKFENSINRATAVANPRQIERVIRGARFKLDIVYEAEDESEVLEDVAILAEGFQLLHYDYLGGNGTRGYGKINISDLRADVVVGELEDRIIAECNEILHQVSAE